MKTLCRSNCLPYSPAESAERMLFGEVVVVVVVVVVGFLSA